MAPKTEEETGAETEKRFCIGATTERIVRDIWSGIEKRDDRIAELEAENARLAAHLAEVQTESAERGIAIRGLIEQRDRVLDALVLGTSVYSLRIAIGSTCVQVRTEGRVGWASHDGTGADIERALLEAVDAAKARQ